MDPDGNGTTKDTVKLDYDGTKWNYSTTISHETKSVGCTFASVTADASIGEQAKLLLQSSAMLPDTALVGEGVDAAYGGDNSGPTTPRRSGAWFAAATGAVGLPPGCSTHTCSMTGRTPTGPAGAALLFRISRTRVPETLTAER